MRCESETIEIPESVTEIGDLKGDGKTGARGCMMLKRVVLGTYVL